LETKVPQILIQATDV